MRLRVRVAGKLLAGELIRVGGGGKEFTHSAHGQGCAQDDCRGWGKTCCTPRMTFLPKVTSFHSIWQGMQFPGDCSQICGYVW